jgi:excisionase family DNA binding protein
MTLPRMRTAPQLAAEYKAADPTTPINTHFLRQLINTGKIPYVKAGKKYLINADVVDAYLVSGQKRSVATEEYGTIRPLRERA